MGPNDVFVFTRKATFVGWLLNNRDRILRAIDDDDHFEDFDSIYREVAAIFEKEETQ